MSAKCRPVVGSSRMIERPAGRGPAELGGELDALGFAAGERRARLAERQVSQPDVVQRIEPSQDPRHGVEERAALVDAHLQHVADRLPLEADFQRLTVEPLAAAFLAGDVQVGQEVHREPALAQALAGFAPAPLGVEAEPAGPVAADLGLAGQGEDPADLVEHARGRRRRRARAAADRALVDLDELVDRLETQNAVRSLGDSAPGRWRERRTARASTSWTSVLLPEPLTPVTQVKAARGIRASTCFKLWSGPADLDPARTRARRWLGSAASAKPWPGTGP